ncbi:MAG TPA: DUF1385 domain-containing protein, partial [Fervidobacterium nodosum]|nr:DUF1385 domain-containing protein [Fervidobacterium nodosum]
KYPSLRILAAPGLLLQRLTTAQPDDSQLEVAIVSLRHALGMFEMLDSVNLENENNSRNDKVDDQPEFLG